MGSRGPIPKRSNERTRRHKAGKDGIEIKKGEALEWEWVEANEEWPDYVQEYYNAFQQSGMKMYFQQTDVRQLYLACEMMAQQFNTGRPSAMMIAEAFKLLDGLGATEGERRRMKIELEKYVEPEDDSGKRMAQVTNINDRLNQSSG